MDSAVGLVEVLDVVQDLAQRKFDCAHIPLANRDLNSLSYAKATENSVEDVVGHDIPDHSAEIIDRLTEVGGDQLVAKFQRDRFGCPA